MFFTKSITFLIVYPLLPSLNILVSKQSLSDMLFKRDCKYLENLTRLSSVNLLATNLFLRNLCIRLAFEFFLDIEFLDTSTNAGVLDSALTTSFIKTFFDT